MWWGKGYLGEGTRSGPQLLSKGFRQVGLDAEEVVPVPEQQGMPELAGR